MTADRACQVQLLAQAAAAGAGEPRRWPDEGARALARGRRPEAGLREATGSAAGHEAAHGP